MAGPAAAAAHAPAHAAAHAGGSAARPAPWGAAAGSAAPQGLQEVAVLLLGVLELAAVQALHVALVLLVDLALYGLRQLEHLAALVGALVLAVPRAAADEARLLLELLR